MIGFTWYAPVNKDDEERMVMPDEKWHFEHHGNGRGFKQGRRLAIQIKQYGGVFWGGFGWLWGPSPAPFAGGSAYEIAISLPDWFIMLLSGSIAAWRVRERVKSKMHLRKDMVAYCQKCGYDLRASKDRCPECGTPKYRA